MEKTYQDAKGNTKGWPKGTENWSDGSGKTSRRFNVQDMADHKHPTQHNLSPVEGDHGPAHEADVYADHHETKANWHYDRWGKDNPRASLARAGLSDFKSRVARNYPK